MVRSADEMNGGEEGGVPPAKRQKVAKLPGGAYYPEEDWINLHPVRSLLLFIYYIPSVTNRIYLSRPVF